MSWPPCLRLSLSSRQHSGHAVSNCAQQWPLRLRILAPALLGLPYALVSFSNGLFRWTWLALYTLLPVLISLLLYGASLADPEQRGEWRDFLILGVLGLAVDLRWFEPAWGPGLAIFNKVLLLDAGIYGFLAIRQLQPGWFRPAPSAARLPRLACSGWPRTLPLALPSDCSSASSISTPTCLRPGMLSWAWIFTFFFIAVPGRAFLSRMDAKSS